jgi:hypothetical protein
MKILNCFTGAVIFESSADAMLQTILDAIAADANLSGANLSGANLSGANLSGAYLRDANLRDANLRDADLSGAYLRSADLSGADLSDAYLRDANLRSANLRSANLSGADLSGAYLRGANLSGANLSGADLSGADLRSADLSGADLRSADLSGTCLSPYLHTYARQFAQTCKPVGRNGGRIVYRTATSQHVGSTQYTTGKTYTAPVLSWDAATECHPGIYAFGTLAELRAEYGDTSAVRCYVRDGDYTITAKNAIRCKRIRVLSEVAA